MRRRYRAAAGRVRGHLTGVLVAAAVGATVAIVFSGDPVSATPHSARTVPVHFTGSSPKPESVQLRSGDSVRFANRLNKSGKVKVAPGVRAKVASVSVLVRGAARTDFVLAGDDDSQTLTYTGPLTVHYTATYTFTLLPELNVLGDNLAPETFTISTTGQLVIAAPGVSVPEPERHDRDDEDRDHHDQDDEDAQPPGGSGADQQSGTESMPAAGAGSGTGAPVAPVGTAAPAAPAERASADAPWAASGGWVGIGGPPPPAVLSSSADRSTRELPPVATSGGTPPGNGDPLRTAGLGLPALAAIGLLSVVTAALVRSLIIQREESIHRPASLP